MSEIPFSGELKYNNKNRKEPDLASRGFKALFSFFNTKESERTNTEVKPQELEQKPYRYAPDLSRLSDYHTEQEISRLADKWEKWLNSSVLAENLGDTVESFYDREKDHWGLSELETFFDNCKDAQSNIKKRGSFDGKTVADRINFNLNDLKHNLGHSSKAYVNALEEYTMDIRDGKFKGSRLSYDKFMDSIIIFSSQINKIQKDDEKREELTINRFYMEDDY